jgi:hypothetical protein
MRRSDGAIMTEDELVETIAKRDETIRQQRIELDQKDDTIRGLKIQLERFGEWEHYSLPGISERDLDEYAERFAV